MAMTGSIEYSTFIDAAPKTVYSAIATAEGLDSWFTCGSEVDPCPGGKIRLRWKNFGVNRYTGEDGIKVLEAIPGNRFVFTWQPGISVTTVSFTLVPHGYGTLVILRDTGYNDNQEDNEALMICVPGWGEALTLLKFYLEYGVTYGEVPPPV